MRLPLTIALLAGVTTASCLLDDSDGDGTNYVGVNAIAEAYKDAQCTHLAACGIFPSREACLMAQVATASTFDIDPTIEQAIYAGHVIYNGSNVKACLDALAARSCDKTAADVRKTPQECSAFFRGTLMGGAQCYVDQECVSQRCSGSGQTSCSLGTCIGDTAPVIVPAAIGENCLTVNGCVDGAYCDQLTDQCTALKGGGVSCTLDNECAYSLGCVGTTGARACGPLPAVGQACLATSGICRDEGTYCDTTADMCKQVGLPSAQCTSSTQCSTYYPCKFTTSPGVCTQGPSAGMPCSSSNRCFDVGTYCDFNTAICVAVKADGQVCSTAEECDSGFCDFNSTTPVCASPMTCF